MHRLLVVLFLAGCSRAQDVAGTLNDGGANPNDDGASLGNSEAGGGGCSGDLQKVVDQNGNVVKNCAPDKGCWNGQCIDACEAAANSHGSIGCDFLIPTPIVTLDGNGLQPCIAVMVSNNWPKPIHPTLDRNGSLDISTAGRVVGMGSDAKQWSSIGQAGIPQDQVGIIFLSADPGAETHLVIPQAMGPSLDFYAPQTCPVPPAVNAPTVAMGPKPMGWASPPDGWLTTHGKAFRLHTDYPVSLYDIAPYGGAMSFTPSAELLLPTSAYDTNYVLASVPFFYPNGAQYVQVVATENNTTVKITPTRAIAKGTDGVTPGTDVNVTGTWILNAGEYVQFANLYDPNEQTDMREPSGYWANMEISGSPIQSDKPVGVHTGHTDLDLWTSTSDTTYYPLGGAADGVHQQLAPVRALGFDYVIAPYATRRKDGQEEALFYRIVGAADGTQLAWDPPQTQAPMTLKQGERADFEITGAFRVTSQDANHPFEIMQAMSGAMVKSKSRPGITPNLPILQYFVGNPTSLDWWTNWSLGDPDVVVMFPPAQWLDHYAFFTDPTYGLTTLTFARAKGSADVTLDCIGTITGWKPVGTAGKYEYAQVDIWREAKSVGTCTNGRHLAQSTTAFGLVVWGMDSFASYGYPAGGNVGKINDVIVPVR